MKYIIIHHTGGTDLNPYADTSHHTFDIVNRFHGYKWNFKSSLGYYIGYHYFIERNGLVTQGRADNEEGAHTKGYNKNIGICLAGNFDATKPTSAQTKALRTLLQNLKLNNPNAEIVPHRKFASKSCYGRYLSDTWASDLLRKPTIDDLMAQVQELIRILAKFLSLK